MFKLIVVINVIEVNKNNYADSEAVKELISAFKKDRYIKLSKNIIGSLLTAAEKSLTGDRDLSSVINSNFLNNNDFEKIYTKCIDFMKLNNQIAWLFLDEFDVIIDLFKSSESNRFFFHQTIATSLLEIAYNGHKIKSDNITPFPK